MTTPAGAVITGRVWLGHFTEGSFSGVILLGYDAALNVTIVTDPMSSTMNYRYDGLSRLISVTQPLGQTVRYQWDARDRLAKKILARSSLGGSSEHREIRYTYETWGPLALAKHFAKSSDTTPLNTLSYVHNLADMKTNHAISAGSWKFGVTTTPSRKHVTAALHRSYRYGASETLRTAQSRFGDRGCCSGATRHHRGMPAIVGSTSD